MGRELWREGHGPCHLEALSTDAESFPVVFTSSVLFISSLLGVFWINRKRPKKSNWGGSGAGHWRNPEHELKSEG